MSRFWSPLVNRLSPYVPGEQPKQVGLIKLNTNELPWPPSPRVAELVRQSSTDQLRRYPDPESQALCEAFARQQSIKREQVFVGNGSDEVLAHSFQALFQPGRPVLFPDITYSFYPVYCDLYGLSSQRPELAADYAIDLRCYERDNGGIIFPNPNAPTGVAVPLAHIEQLLEVNRDSVVVVDEAYIDFGGESAVPLITDWPNLLVVQTLSKSRGLAGLRVGAAFGDEGLIEGLRRVKNSFNSYPLDRLAEIAAVAALEDETWFRASCEKLIALRDTLANSLGELGFEVLPSAANFLFVRHAQRDAAQLAVDLRANNILVRHFAQPRIDQFLRISVGTKQECDALVTVLQELLHSGSA
jgi:histidinol-phosphate aminotransferase